MANALTRVIDRIVGKAEGQTHGPPYTLPVTGGWLGAEGMSWNWWQNGYTVRPFTGASAMVEACVSAYAQTVAMCPGSHWKMNSKNGRDRVITSALSRILREPNDYQSISDFLLNATRQLYLDGNAYALALRNSRYEIEELHLMDSRLSYPQVAEDGSIFYVLGGNAVIARRLGEDYGEMFPARDVFHVKLHANQTSYNYPLKGLSPILAVAIDMATSGALKQQQIQFYTNAARPSFVLSTDLLLKKDQVDAARDRWDLQSKGMNQGGTPILTGGLKPYPVTISSREAQLAEVMKMSDEAIALAFRVPLQVLGIKGGPHGSTEVLMHEWVASGLGFCLNHIEEALGQKFDLWGQPDEYVEFDTSALLRSAFKDRIAALKEGVTGGIFTPNEARNQEGLDDVPYGDEPRMQQQQVPLSAAAGIPAGPPGQQLKPIPPAPPAPPAPTQPGPQARSPPNARALSRSFLQRADRIERRDHL